MTDIFSNIPNSVWANERIKMFLDELKNALSAADIGAFALPSLVVSQNDYDTVIEWIFEDFRTYFFFSKDGDCYGRFEKEEGKIRNRYDHMEKKDYPKVAKWVVEWVMEKLTKN